MDPRQGPLEFRLNADNAPWAGNYFAMLYGGIAYRWKEDSYPQQIHNKKKRSCHVLTGTPKFVPVEKYDVLMGNYDFRTTDHELKVRGPLRAMAEPWNTGKDSATAFAAREFFCQNPSGPWRCKTKMASRCDLNPLI